MEPVTHILTGVCLARTGLNRRAAYATLGMAVAAEFPDIDTLWGLRGPVSGFQHHRGITHTFLGIPFEAALIVAGLYGIHRLRLWRAARAAPVARDTQARTTPSFTAAPVRWGLLYTFVLLALLSHLWLDFTNNYGLRPFFPFNPRWYAASITFIFDPAMFLLLLGAVVLPPLFRLVGAEVGARKQPFAARGWAAAAMVGVAGLWAWRAIEHSRAEQMTRLQTYSLETPRETQQDMPAADAEGSPEAPLQAATPTLLQPQRVNLSPDPINPLRWYSTVDFGPLYQLGTVDLHADTLVPQQAIETKPAASTALLAAERSPLGRAYLDWSSMPLLRVAPAGSDVHQVGGEPAPGATVVTFRDPRFLGDMRWLRSAGPAPLTGSVWVDAHGAVLREMFDGKVQR